MGKASSSVRKSGMMVNAGIILRHSLGRCLMASVYPGRVLSFTPSPGHLGNVGLSPQAASPFMPAVAQPRRAKKLNL